MFSGNVPDGDENVERRDNKKDKDKGYVAFYSDDEDVGVQGDDEAVSGYSASITRVKSKKSKKEKTVKLPRRKIKINKKEKGKVEKEKEKEKLKDKKKNKKPDLPEQPALPVFGVSLEEAVKRSMLPDGLKLPRVVRECIMKIEEKGLTQEGIYRLSGVKSRVEMLKELYNQGKKVDLDEYEPNILAGLVKLFIRELSDSMLPDEIAQKFEEAAALLNRQDKINRFKKLITELPECNKTLLSWLMMHMLHVLQQTSENKMSIQSVGIVLHPTTGIAQPVLNVLLNNISTLFADTKLTNYEPPSKPDGEDMATLATPEEIAAELSRQEDILAQLHEDLNKGKPDETDGKDEELWEVQRKVTQLKRKLRVAKRNRNAEVVEEQKKQENKPPTKEDEEEEMLKRLEQEEMELRFEEEELLAVREQLEKRLQNEKSEIQRLQEEITAVKEVRANNSGVQSDQNSSSESDGSESDEDESELEEIMNDLVQQNEELEAKNMKLVKQLHEEQESCVELKVQIRMLVSTQQEP